MARWLKRGADAESKAASDRKVRDTVEGILGDIEVAEKPNEGRENPPRVAAVDPVHHAPRPVHGVLQYLHRHVVGTLRAGDRDRKKLAKPFSVF